MNDKPLSPAEADELARLRKAAHEAPKEGGDRSVANTFARRGNELLEAMQRLGKLDWRP